MKRIVFSLLVASLSIFLSSWLYFVYDKRATERYENKVFSGGNDSIKLYAGPVPSPPKVNLGDGPDKKGDPGNQDNTWVQPSRVIKKYDANIFTTANRMRVKSFAALTVTTSSPS
jgi:hypothetical protein